MTNTLSAQYPSLNRTIRFFNAMLTALIEELDDPLSAEFVRMTEDEQAALRSVLMYRWMLGHVDLAPHARQLFYRRYKDPLCCQLSEDEASNRRNVEQMLKAMLKGMPGHFLKSVAEQLDQPRRALFEQIAPHGKENKDNAESATQNKVDSIVA